MKRTKIISFVLCIVLCFNLGVPAFAINEDVVFSANDITVEISNEDRFVTVELTLSKATNVGSVTYNITTPTGIELTGIACSQLGFTGNNYNLSEGTVNWYADGEDLTGITSIGSLTFKIPANTPVKDYTVSITDIELTENYEPYGPTVPVTATITISEPIDTNNPKFTVYYQITGSDSDHDNFYEVDPGAEVNVDVYVKADQTVTMQAFDIYPEWDEKLAFAGIEANEAAGITVVNKMADANPHFQTQFVENGNTDTTIDKNGTMLATLKFTLSEDAVYGNRYPVYFGADTNLARAKNAESATVTYEKDAATATIGVETLKTYTVTYDANAGTDTVTGMPNPATAQKPHNAKLENLPQLTRASYNFLGWATSAGATEAEYTTELPANVNPAEGITLYAVWKANTHTVTWKNFDGSNFDTTEVTHGQKPSDPGTPTYTKEGYATTFQGWATSANQTSGTALEDIPAVTTDGVVYYAAFSAVPNSYTIAFNSNEGTGTMTSMGAIYDQEVTLTTNTFERTGYTFNGWNTKADGTGDNYANNAKVTNLTSVANGTVTLYAQWTINTYDVTYDVEGTETKKEDIAYNTSIELITPAAKTGYTFDGWYDDNTRVGGAGDSYTVTGNVTLTAKYDPIKYHVEFDLDGVTIKEGAPAKIENAVYDTTVIIMPTVTANGYTFAGWKHGSETYAAGTKKTNLTTENNATVTLVAQWTTNKWNVFSDDSVQNGTVSAKNQIAANGTSANMGDTIVVTIEPVTGYQLKNGSLKYIATDDQGNALTDAQHVDITTMSDGNYTFTMPDSHVKVTAEFEQIDYTATVGAVENGTVTLGDNKTEVTVHYQDTVTVNVTPNAGYEVEAVTYTVNGTEKTITATNGAYSFKMPDSNVTVSATFKKKQITLTFVSDGATYNTVTGEYESAVKTPAAPTKTGYTFAGWSPAVPNTMPAEDMTITAQWNINQYTITFDTDGGNAIDPITKNYGAEVGTVDNPTKTGYNFVKWVDANTNADATVPTTMPANNMTLKAIWEADTYTVTLNTNGGTIAEGKNITSYTYSPDTAVTLPVTADMTKDYYTFAGWYDNEQFTGTPVLEIPAGSTDAKTYWAKWTANSYVITFNPNGGTVDPTSMNYTYETTTLTLPTPTWEHHSFQGWYVSADSGSWVKDTKFSMSAGSHGHVTVYAKWEGSLSHVVEDYKYAPANYVMLRIETTTKNTSGYTFGDIEMYYTADTKYQLSNNPVLVTLIPKDNGAEGDAKVVYVSGTQLTDAGLAMLRPTSNGAATYDRTSGLINKDEVVNIADANAVYQMVIHEGSYYSLDQLSILKRLMADMDTDDVAAKRGSIADVNAIITIINNAANPTTNP